jgi:hypothetical protein
MSLMPVVSSVLVSGSIDRLANQRSLNVVRCSMSKISAEITRSNDWDVAGNTRIRQS